MKKTIAIILTAAIILFALSACSGKTEVSREVLDWSYTAPYYGVETEYQYQYNLLGGEFVLVPVVTTVYHDEAYKLQYRITYSDGSIVDTWEEVTAEEYWKEVGE